MGQIIGRDPNLIDLYGGIAGAILPCERFDLGFGVTLSRTYAHFMNPELMAFGRPEEGKPHPAPWKSISGGRYFDVEVSIHVPSGFEMDHWFDRINCIWWVVALMRFRCSSRIRVPVIVDTPFHEIVRNNVDPAMWTVELEPNRVPVGTDLSELSLDDLEWIKKYWISAGKLMNSNENFNAAFQALDNSTWSQNPALGLILLWGGIERLFCGVQQELSFRASASVSSYLEDRGQNRYELYKRIKKLYGHRSKAAHGTMNSDISAFRDTHEVLRRCLEKIILSNEVPTQEQLEIAIFS